MENKLIEIIHKDKDGNLLFAGSHEELRKSTVSFTRDSSWASKIDRNKTQMMVCGEMIFINDKEPETPKWLLRKIDQDKAKSKSRSKR